MNTKPDSALPSQPAGKREPSDEYLLGIGRQIIDHEYWAYSEGQRAEFIVGSEEKVIQILRGLVQAARSSSPEGEPADLIERCARIAEAEGMVRPEEGGNIARWDACDNVAREIRNLKSELAAAPSREWIKRAKNALVKCSEFCNEQCGWDKARNLQKEIEVVLAEEIIARHAAQQNRT